MNRVHRTRLCASSKRYQPEAQARVRAKVKALRVEKRSLAATQRPACFTFLIVLLAWVSFASGQETAPAFDEFQTTDPLATKQQIVRDRMTQLEDRMFRLAEKLTEAEPQQAKRLESALRQSREQLIRRNMDEIITLLDQSELAGAADRQILVSKALEQVLEILLAEPDYTQQREKEIDRLQDFLDRVNALLDREQKLKDQSDAASGKGANQQETLPNKPDHAEAAAKQRELKQQADQLAERMQSKSSNQQQPPAPGTQNVQQASGHMNNAADDLDKQQPAEAGKDQQEAINELEQAQLELEQVLDQLRREQQEEILRSLESRFRAMLTRQLAVNKGTDELENKGRENWTHGDELTLAGLAQEETNLADEAAGALHVLKQEGTTVVFPQVVEQLKEDILAVARRLREKQTGPVTGRIEADIVTTLEELIEAVREHQEKLQSGQADGGGAGDVDVPLLPDSAELKMLRSCQLRVNRRTADFNQEGDQTVPWNAEQHRELERIAKRQRQVADMAKKMNERIAGQ